MVSSIMDERPSVKMRIEKGVGLEQQKIGLSSLFAVVISLVQPVFFRSRRKSIRGRLLLCMIVFLCHRFAPRVAPSFDPQSAEQCYPLK